MAEPQPLSPLSLRGPRGVIRRLAIGVGGVCMAAAMISFGCSDQLLLFPSRHTIYTPGLERVQAQGPQGAVEILSIPTTAARGREPAAFVLHFIGNGSRAEGEGPYVAEQWRPWPVHVWAVNYPGYGASAGSAKLRSIAPAALAAFDALKARAAGRPIFVSGRSMGTTAALYVAAHRPVAGVILHSPPPLRSLIVSHYGWWNLWIAAGPVAMGVPSELDSIANAKSVAAPAVFIITDADEIVPPDYQQKVFDAYAGTKKAIHYAAGHNDPVHGAAQEEFRNNLDGMWNSVIADWGREHSETRAAARP